jgi:hypothetical protein
MHPGGVEVPLSHRGVEIILGRLIVDEAVRDRFTRAPATTLRELAALGLELNPVEFAALVSVSPAALQRLARSLDPRLQKAALIAPVIDDTEEEEP